jgi:hypothetical protein
MGSWCAVQRNKNGVAVSVRREEDDDPGGEEGPAAAALRRRIPPGGRVRAVPRGRGRPDAAAHGVHAQQGRPRLPQGNITSVLTSSCSRSRSPHGDARDQRLTDHIGRLPPLALAGRVGGRRGRARGGVPRGAGGGRRQGRHQRM